MITWKRLQSEHKAWTEYNFAPHTFLWPLWGTIEELGELVHARLKQEQGIRGTPEEHLANQKDAIGDSLIFLSDVCSQKGWDLGEISKTESPEAFQKTYKAPSGKSPIRVCLGALSTVMTCLEDSERIQDQDEKDLLDAHARQAVHIYLTGLSGYCHEKSWSLQEIVEETWKVVKTRDWKKDKQNGGTPVTSTKEPERFLPLSEMVEEDPPTPKGNWTGTSAKKAKTDRSLSDSKGGRSPAPETPREKGNKDDF